MGHSTHPCSLVESQGLNKEHEPVGTCVRVANLPLTTTNHPPKGPVLGKNSPYKGNLGLKWP